MHFEVIGGHGVVSVVLEPKIAHRYWKNLPPKKIRFLAQFKVPNTPSSKLEPRTWGTGPLPTLCSIQIRFTKRDFKSTEFLLLRVVKRFSITEDFMNAGG